MPGVIGHRRESQTKEELMVSNDVMRLEIKRLRDTLNGAADEVFGLENRRQQLSMSMKERKAEIQVIAQRQIHSQPAQDNCPPLRTQLKLRCLKSCVGCASGRK